jgi:hypothetical protein
VKLPTFIWNREKTERGRVTDLQHSLATEKAIAIKDLIKEPYVEILTVR